MADTHTTRRGLLRLGTGALAYGAGAAAVTAAGFAVSQAKGAEPSEISPELVRLLAVEQAAQEASDAYHERVYLPASAACEAQIAAVPHTTIHAGTNIHGDPIEWTTADRLDVAKARGIVSISPERQNSSPEWQTRYRAARKLTAAAKWRDRAIERIKRDADIAAMVEKENRLNDAWVEKLNDMASFEPNTMLDLLAIIDRLELRDGLDDEVHLSTLVDAVRHLGRKPA